MTKQQFLEAFKSALAAENASPDFVSEQTALLSGKIEALSDEEFAKRASDENIAMLVRSTMEEYLSRTKHSSSNGAEKTNEAQDVASAPTITVEATKRIDSVPERPEAENVSSPDKNDDIVTVDMTPVVSSKKKSDAEKEPFWKSIAKKAEERTPTLLFTILAVLSFPLLLFAAFVVIGAIFSIYFALAALVIALVAAIIVVVCGGGLTALIALLYGATQILQEPRYIGMHEIGFALIVIGATILISVLLYNAAVKLVPWVLSKASVIFKAIVVRVRRLAEKAKKGCDNL